MYDHPTIGCDESSSELLHTALCQLSKEMRDVSRGRSVEGMNVWRRVD